MLKLQFLQGQKKGEVLRRREDRETIYLYVYICVYPSICVFRPLHNKTTYYNNFEHISFQAFGHETYCMFALHAVIKMNTSLQRLCTSVRL